MGSKLENKTICTWCIHRYGRKSDELQYVSATSRYISMCNATKKTVKCENRNTKGNCRYYVNVGRDFPI